MKLSPHFHLSELCRSQTASRANLDNTPPHMVIERLRALCERVLEPVRALYGKPVVVSSGYRAPEVNKLVSGRDTGQHVLGEAADFEIPGVDNLELARRIAGSSIPFDQLILEYYDGTPSSGWIHVSHRKSHNRGEVLTAYKGTPPRYSKGLP